MSYYTDILRLGFHEIQKAKALKMIAKLEREATAAPLGLLREMAQLDAEARYREMDEDASLAPVKPVSHLRLIQGEIT